MISSQAIYESKFQISTYVNGQMAVYLRDFNGNPVAELSIMTDYIKLSKNEFILKNYGENREIAKEIIKNGIFSQTNQIAVIGRETCPIYKVEMRF